MLSRMMSKYSPEIQSLAKEILERMRKLTPGATEFVYDNYAALVIGFGPTDRPSDAVMSIALYPRWVNLGFLEGALLDDPQGILRGTGTQFRNIKLTASADMDAPAVRALIAQAIANAAQPFNRRRRRKIDIRVISAKQRSRRPSSRSATSDTASQGPPRSTPRPRGRPAR
jgi:hypothetical protein